MIFEHYDKRRKILLTNLNHEIKLMRNTIITQPDEHARNLSGESMVYNWQFVSFMRSNGTTLDLIIRKECDLLSLINVVQQAIYLPEMQQRL